MANVTVNIINKPPESPVEGVGARILMRSLAVEGDQFVVYATVWIRATEDGPLIESQCSVPVDCGVDQSLDEFYKEAEERLVDAFDLSAQGKEAT